ncbi:MAG: Methenyltetrahydrofolate cyclohydrolase [Parcubacteria group bacterium]|nr:Methenyltetrahydrofolate cyclohydrolase [Parcubacteria group bacterium]
MNIDGCALAREINARTKSRAEQLPQAPFVVAYTGPNPTPTTLSYLKIKKRSAEAAGCRFEETESLEFRSEVDGIIVQLPLPKNMNTQDVLNSIPLEKDADVLCVNARDRFERGDRDAILPPVVSAIQKILEKANISVADKKAVVIGAGFLVGAPVALWLRQQGADVSVVTLESGDLVASLRTADIIVSGTGSPHLIKPDMIKEGVVLIDAGSSELGGVVVGDADPVCAEKCSLFTPVPGGVGPVAVACLFENAVTLAERATKA